MLAKKQVPVLSGWGYEQLFCENGDPIWPLANNQEKRAVRNVAKLFGADISFVSSSPNAESQSQNGLVVALGEEASRFAALYSHLTCRDHCCVSEFEELLLLQEKPSVVVVEFSRVTVDLINQLHNLGGGGIGIISGRGEAGLRVNILTRSASLYLCGVDSGYEKIELSPEDAAVGGDRDHLLDLLGGQAGVLALTTHSGVVDALLPGNLSLCVREGGLDADSTGNAPRCFLTDYCHRQEMGVDEAKAEGLLIGVDSIRSQVFIWNTCWGVPPSSPMLMDTSWSLLRAMLSHDGLGVLVTTWEISITGPGIIQPLLSSLCAGISVGDALSEANRSARWTEVGLRMCVFGDPQLKLAPQHEQSRSLPNKFADARRAFNDDPRTTEMHERRAKGAAFMRSHLLTAMASLSGENAAVDDGRNAERIRGISDATNSALEAVMAYEYAISHGIDTESIANPFGDRMRQAYLRFLAVNKPHRFRGWSELGSYVDQCMRTCRVCGRQAQSRLYSTFSLGYGRRRVVRCMCCGYVEDTPADACIQQSSFSDRQVVSIEGDLPVTSWSACLIFSSQLRSEMISVEWPADDAGSMAKSYRVASPLPVGPTDVLLAVVKEAEPAVFFVANVYTE
ncbi:MAG: hypothetical protein AAF662_03890 [Pseudomonadota bacterium]